MHHAWYEESIFYHIYPLGLCGAPTHNNLSLASSAILTRVCTWIPHLIEMGISAVYLGPLFESESHGYDTIDYFKLDRRLGTNFTLKQVIDEFHRNEIRVVLDGVFHHVGREFYAFQDLQRHLQHSHFKDWFCGVDFQQRSPYGDPFSYAGWNGHHNLVKLNVLHPQVEEHLFDAVRFWIEEFEIDGLRLDAADVLDIAFMRRLAAFVKGQKPDFWLMGEVIHGDYRQWANPEVLHSTTNYEGYKGLYSSFNDRNCFEIAYSLSRLFDDDGGLYRGLYLYNFADNHDVSRVASILQRQEQLFPLYLLLFCMPGLPSLYYGSEWGIEGQKHPDSDQMLRPELHLAELRGRGRADLFESIVRFSRIRHQSSALQHGGYKQLHVAAEQLVFLRRHEEENVVVAINASEQPTAVSIQLSCKDSIAVDRLNEHERFSCRQGVLSLDIPPCWGRVLRIQS